MYLIPPAQAERFPRPYGDRTWWSVFDAIGILAMASATVRSVIPNSRDAVGDLEGACHARYAAATGRSVRSQSDRVLAWAIARIDNPEGDLEDARVFACYDDMVTRRPRAKGEPVRPLIPEIPAFRTVLDLGDGTRWVVVETREQAIAMGHVANSDLADIHQFRRARVPEGEGVYVLADTHPAPRSVTVLALTHTDPEPKGYVEGMTVEVNDPYAEHADAIRALSDHVGIGFVDADKAPTP